MILPVVENQRNCVDPQNLGQSEWDPKLGKIVCVFSLYDKMKWKWHDVHLLQGLANWSSESLYPPSLPLFSRTTANARKLCTWRLWSRGFGAAFGSHNCANLEAIIVRLSSYTCRLWSSEIGDALGGRDQVRLEIHLVLWSSNFGDALRHHDCANREPTIVGM